VAAADIGQDLHAAMAALQAGDPAAARDLLAPLAEADRDNRQLWMGYAETLRQLGDDAAFEGAVDHLISIEPLAVRAYGWKGDLRLAGGDARAAASWYREGVRRAAMLPSVPPGLSSEIERQQAALDTLDAQFGAELAAGLSAAGVAPDAVSDRFAEAVDILNSRAQVQLQKPGLFYFPGLPQRAFYEREEFAWVGAVEAATNGIAAELASALATADGFAPYLTADPERPDRDSHGMTGNPDWSSLELTAKGQPVAQSRERFPKTWAMLDALPLCRIGTRAPTPMFSLLKAGARIPPHHGAINCRLICHLPLVVPGDGALRVGNRTRSWERGKLLIFDDSIEHEAWNDAASDRIVLIFDVWHPMVSAAEQAGIAALFDVVDRHS
jgi:hypothetical protein